MAKVAKQWLVWVSDPKVDAAGIPLRSEQGEMLHDRVEINMDSVVPDSVPTEIQQEWEAKDWVFEDPTKERIEKQEGPPRVTLPPIMTQKMDHARKMTRGIPPRPTRAI